MTFQIFASSSATLPAGWYRIPQETYRYRKTTNEPLVVKFESTLPFWPHNGGILLRSMANTLENADDRPLDGVRECSNITFRFLGPGYDQTKIRDFQLRDTEHITRRELFEGAAKALSLWIDDVRKVKNTVDEPNSLFDQRKALCVASIYFPTSCNVAQVEIIVSPSH